MEFGRLLLLKYDIYITAQISISDVHIHLKKIIQTIFYRNRLFIILYNLWLLSCLFLLCKSLNMYTLTETHVVCVTTASPFLSCQVYIPSIIHISKRIYFNLYLSIYTLGGCGRLKVAQINMYFQNSPGPLVPLPRQHWFTVPSSHNNR